MAIRDQRSMLGLGLPQTVDDVEDAHAGFLARKGLEPVKSRKKLTAYVSDGRWVADCPNCNGGIMCWHENPHGTCLDCGHVYAIEFPKDRAEIEDVLLARPEASRHFLPGESLKDLKVENLTNGVPLTRPTSEG